MTKIVRATVPDVLRIVPDVHDTLHEVLRIVLKALATLPELPQLVPEVAREPPENLQGVKSLFTRAPTKSPNAPTHLARPLTYLPEGKLDAEEELRTPQQGNTRTKRRITKIEESKYLRKRNLG